MRKKFEQISLWLERHAGFQLYAVVLFLVLFTAYDLLVGRMGFNYDDWEGIFLHQQGFSFQQIWEYFLIDRPFSSIVHWIFHPLLGTSVVGWHLLVLFLHWGAILFIVKTILELFPGQIMAAGWVGLLLGLFPGISRHFVARTSSPHYVSMFLFALSLWLMIRAVKSGKVNWALLAISVMLGLVQALIIEYFASMEIVRFFILFYLFAKYGNGQWFKNVKKAFFIWLPYLGVFLIFAYFKFMVLPGLAGIEGLDSKHDISFFSALLADPFATIVNYANLVLQDVIYVIFYAWAGPINPADISLGSKSYLLSWFMGFVVACFSAVAMLYWSRARDNRAEQSSVSGAAVIALSMITLLLGGLPAWLIGRQGIVGLWSSRFFLAQILGAVPIIVALVMAITGRNRQHIANLVFAGLLAMSFSAQFREANRYTLYWDYQREYYWQLKWRAPGLVDKTFILSPYTPLLRNADYQIAYAVNLVYTPGYTNTDSKHWWFDGPDTLRGFYTKEYSPDMLVQAQMRNITFESDMKFALPVISRFSRGCVQVIADDYYQGQPGLSYEEEQMFALAAKNLVLKNGAPMPENIFGSEPEHGWCYYYQKAELARQFDNWDEIKTIWDTVKKQRLESTYGPEYLPFIDMLASQNDWQQAAKITVRAGKITKDAMPFFCDFWKNTLYSYSGFTENASHWAFVQKELVCE